MTSVRFPRAGPSEHLRRQLQGRERLVRRGLSRERWPESSRKTTELAVVERGVPALGGQQRRVAERPPRGDDTRGSRTSSSSPVRIRKAGPTRRRSLCPNRASVSAVPSGRPRGRRPAPGASRSRPVVPRVGKELERVEGVDRQLPDRAAARGRRREDQAPGERAQVVEPGAKQRQGPPGRLRASLRGRGGPDPAATRAVRRAGSGAPTPSTTSDGTRGRPASCPALGALSPPPEIS